MYKELIGSYEQSCESVSLCPSVDPLRPAEFLGLVRVMSIETARVTRLVS